MTQDPVELVARAFYAAEYSGEWRDEPEALKEQFRDLAQAAIATLNHQMVEVRSVTIVPGSLQFGDRGRRAQPRRYVG
jgi:predicted component of type VI protein secretion system